MSRSLKIQSTETSRKRHIMGSIEVAQDCTDAIHGVSLVVLSPNLNLQFDERKYTLYESILPAGIAGFLFGTPDEKLSEDQHRENFLKHFRKLNLR